MGKITYFFVLLFGLFSCSSIDRSDKVEQAATGVLIRTIGENQAAKFDFSFAESKSTDSYSIKVEKNRVHITGSSATAMCRGVYDYLRNDCRSIISWSGNKINIAKQLPQINKTVTSPFKYRYYLNTVTHGYTMPYWDWSRWEKELDWMAIHGINMPLLPGAYEAIIYRVFKKIGLTQKEIDAVFTGPAYLPWNRMGKITGWDGPLPESYIKFLPALPEAWRSGEVMGLKGRGGFELV